MDIIGFILIGIPVMLLFCMGIVGCGFLRNTPAVPTTLPSTVDTGTLAPQYREDLAYLKAYSRSRLKDRSLILSESKKEITPPVEEERKLEYTGIRAIQL